MTYQELNTITESRSAAFETESWNTPESSDIKLTSALLR